MSRRVWDELLVHHKKLYILFDPDTDAVSLSTHFVQQCHVKQTKIAEREDQSRHFIRQ